MRKTSVGTSPLLRLLGCVFNQKSRTLWCPSQSSFKGLVVAVTGATNGIGLETMRLLVDRGATVLMLARNREKAESVRAALGPKADVQFFPTELSDLATISSAIKAIVPFLNGRPIDVLIENAGIWPKRYSKTKQGHEVAFGTNVLGHFVLRQSLINAKCLRGDARVVIVTGDIYILESDCTGDFFNRGILGGSHAYNRSKLGNFWIGQELNRRFPDLIVTLVHPGVVSSDLLVSFRPLDRIKQRILISAEAGAQMPLICATQPEIESGSYYHNVWGLVSLHPDDPANNCERAKQLWNECEALAQPWIVSNFSS